MSREEASVEDKKRRGAPVAGATGISTTIELDAAVAAAFKAHRRVARAL